MRRLGIFGGAGLLALAVLLVVGTQAWPRLQRRIENRATPPATTAGAPVHPSRQATIAGRWSVRLDTYGPYTDLGSAPVLVSQQGQLVLVKLRLLNIGDEPLPFRPSEVFLETGSRQTYFPSAQTAAIDPDYQQSRSLTPQSIIEQSLIFDVDPAIINPILHVSDIEFPLPNLLSAG
jgi:hypothetical protein